MYIFGNVIGNCLGKIFIFIAIIFLKKIYLCYEFEIGALQNILQCTDSEPAKYNNHIKARHSPTDIIFWRLFSLQVT